MENLGWGIGLLLAAALLVWLGIRSRRSAYAEYESDRRKYTAATTMTVVALEKSENERWVERDDGSGQELLRETVYIPTYEYTVDGKTYRYCSRAVFSSGKGIGRQVTGYYDPSHPESITESKPRKPILGGGFFFIGAAICVLGGILILRDAIYWMF